MSTRQLLTSLFLAALAELALIAVVVSVGELPRFGGASRHVGAADLAYLVVPLVLACAAAYLPVRVLVRRRHGRRI